MAAIQETVTVKFVSVGEKELKGVLTTIADIAKQQKGDSADFLQLKRKERDSVIEYADKIKAHIKENSRILKDVYVAETAARKKSVDAEVTKIRTANETIRAIESKTRHELKAMRAAIRNHREQATETETRFVREASTKQKNELKAILAEAEKVQKLVQTIGAKPIAVPKTKAVAATKAVAKDQSKAIDDQIKKALASYEKKMAALEKAVDKHKKEKATIKEKAATAKKAAKEEIAGLKSSNKEKDKAIKTNVKLVDSTKKELDALKQITVAAQDATLTVVNLANKSNPKIKVASDTARGLAAEMKAVASGARGASTALVQGLVPSQTSLRFLNGELVKLDRTLTKASKRKTHHDPNTGRFLSKEQIKEKQAGYVPTTHRYTEQFQKGKDRLTITAYNAKKATARFEELKVSSDKATKTMANGMQLVKEKSTITESGLKGVLQIYESLRTKTKRVIHRDPNTGKFLSKAQIKEKQAGYVPTTDNFKKNFQSGKHKLFITGSSLKKVSDRFKELRSSSDETTRAMASGMVLVGEDIRKVGDRVKLVKQEYRTLEQKAGKPQRLATHSLVVDPKTGAADLKISAPNKEAALARLTELQKGENAAVLKGIELYKTKSGVGTKGLQTIEMRYRSLQDVQKKTVSSADNFISRLGQMARFRISSALTNALFKLRRTFIDMIDAYQRFQKQFRVVDPGGGRAAGYFKRLLDIAKSTRQPLKDVVDQYQRFGFIMRRIGYTQSDIGRFVKVLGTHALIGGSEPGETSRASVQLGQGVASGNLRGDEYRSVSEQLRSVTFDLATYLQVSIGELRKLAHTGKLTSDVVIEGLFAGEDRRQAQGFDIEDLQFTFSDTANKFSSTVATSTIAILENTRALDGLQWLLRGLTAESWIPSAGLAGLATLFGSTLISSLVKSTRLALKGMGKFGLALALLAGAVTAVVAVFGYLQERASESSKDTKYKQDKLPRLAQTTINRGLATTLGKKGRAQFNKELSNASVKEELLGLTSMLQAEVVSDTKIKNTDDKLGQMTRQFNKIQGKGNPLTTAAAAGLILHRLGGRESVNAKSDEVRELAQRVAKALEVNKSTVAIGKYFLDGITSQDILKGRDKVDAYPVGSNEEAFNLGWKAPDTKRSSGIGGVIKNLIGTGAIFDKITDSRARKKKREETKRAHLGTDRDYGAPFHLDRDSNRSRYAREGEYETEDAYKKRNPGPWGAQGPGVERVITGTAGVIAEDFQHGRVPERGGPNVRTVVYGHMGADMALNARSDKNFSRRFVSEEDADRHVTESIVSSVVYLANKHKVKGKAVAPAQWTPSQYARDRHRLQALSPAGKGLSGHDRKVLLRPDSKQFGEYLASHKRGQTLEKNNTLQTLLLGSAGKGATYAERLRELEAEESAKAYLNKHGLPVNVVNLLAQTKKERETDRALKVQGGAAELEASRGPMDDYDYNVQLDAIRASGLADPIKKKLIVELDIEKLDKSISQIDQFKSTIFKAVEETNNMGQDAGKIILSSVQTVSQGVAESITRIGEGAKALKDIWVNVLKDMAKQLIQSAVHNILLKLVGSLVGSAFGDVGGASTTAPASGFGWGIAESFGSGWAQSIVPGQGFPNQSSNFSSTMQRPQNNITLVQVSDNDEALAAMASADGEAIIIETVNANLQTSS